MNTHYENLVIQKIEKLTGRKVKDIVINTEIPTYIPYGSQDVFNVIELRTKIIPIFFDIDKVLKEMMISPVMIDTVFVKYEEEVSSDHSNLKLLSSVISNAEIIYQ